MLDGVFLSLVDGHPSILWHGGIILAIPRLLYFSSLLLVRTIAFRLVVIRAREHACVRVPTSLFFFCPGLCVCYIKTNAPWHVLFPCFFALCTFCITLQPANPFLYAKWWSESSVCSSRVFLDRNCFVILRYIHPALTVEGRYNIRKVFRVWTSLNKDEPLVTDIVFE
jgi:hypothetical protein